MLEKRFDGWKEPKSSQNGKKKGQKYQILFTNVAKRPEAAYVVISKRLKVFAKVVIG